MKKFILFLFLFLFPSLAFSSGGNETIESFSKAKRLLEEKVYFDHRITIYCGATFNEDKTVNIPDGFVSPTHEKRQYKIEWEHSVPAENFGRAFDEWREGDELCVDSNGKSYTGRKCAEKASRQYRLMQADMYNLYPAIGSVNAIRSNKMYLPLPYEEVCFGSCQGKTNGTYFEPPDRAKGEVSRSCLYMDLVYDEYHLSDQQRQLFTAWSILFPVSEWECSRCKRIEEIQGNENPIVKELCIQSNMWK